MAPTYSAKVKNVLSGDTVVLVPIKTSQFPVPERLLTLQYVRGDTFRSREFLRNLLIGKEVKFSVLFKIPATGKEFGDIHAPIFSSLIEYLLQHGQVKLKDNIRSDSDDEADFIEGLRKLEAAAQLKKVGIWGPKFADPTVVDLSPEIIEKSKKQALPVVIEKVISGDRVIARIFANANKHVLLPLLLAGIKCPRTDDTAALKIAHQAKHHVETHLLTTKAELKVTIIGENQAGVPLALFEHPSGNVIQESLLENGLAEVVDWQSSLVGSATMSSFRKAEQKAKALAKDQYASESASSAAPAPAAGAAKGVVSSKTLRVGSSVDGVTIAKVINGDTFNIRLPNDEEITVQLASIRAPRPNDTTVTSNSLQQQALVQMSREYARNHAVGKTAKLYIDGFRQANPDLGLDSRFLVSLSIGGKDLSEQLVNNGLATVIKHNKQTAGERSTNWDRLIELEEAQKKAGKKGVFYSGNDISKVLTLGSRIVNASENVQKAKTFFNGFQKKGRVSGFYVEYVVAANRVRLYSPREGTKLTLILGGLSNDKHKESGDLGVEYLNKKYLQRNVEFEVYDTDKIGGFIGNLYASPSALKPVQIELLEQGLVSIHEFAVNSNKYANDLEGAEKVAKQSHKGIWKDYDEAAAQASADEAKAKMQQLNLESSKPKFFDIEVVDISENQVLSYHLIDAETSAQFTKFKSDFNQFHAQNPSASLNSTDLPYNLTKGPKKNELVSAKFDENNKYYRAKVVNFDRLSNKYEVKHIDFGNVDKVPLSSLRALPKNFGIDKFKPFAHTCKLQNITLPPNQPNDYLTDAIYLLEDLTFDKKLVLSGITSSTPGVEYDAVLYDAEKSLTDPTYTINAQLVADGYGIVESAAPAALKDYVSSLLQKQQKAKDSHLGCWELGDITGNGDDF